MKIQIRQSVFETNSSSTHSMTIAMKSDYEAWQEGTMLYCDGDFIAEEKGKEENANWLRKRGIPEDTIKDYLSGYKTLIDLVNQKYIRRWDIGCSLWHDSVEEDYYESYSTQESFFETFKTPGGEEIVVFGSYGYDG